MGTERNLISGSSNEASWLGRYGSSGVKATHDRCNYSFVSKMLNIQGILNGSPISFAKYRETTDTRSVNVTQLMLRVWQGIVLRYEAVYLLDV